jgi:hypothetical protein
MLYRDLMWLSVVLLTLYLQHRDRESWRKSNETLQRQLVALVDKAAVSVVDSEDHVASGKVTYMDEKREWELEQNAS